MKLQLNSLEALERLIGGDTEIEIEIRNSIVQEFSKKHLKNIAKEISQGTLKDLFNDELKVFYRQDGWGNQLTISAKHKKELKSEVKYFFEQSVKEVIKEELKEKLETIPALITEKLTQLVDNEIGKLSVSNRIDRIITKRLIDNLK